MEAKTPPSAVEVEKEVLGTAMQYPSACSEMIEIFRKEKAFYDPKHQVIYDTLVEMYQKSETIDLITISQKLKSKNQLEGIGGDYFLIELTQTSTSSSNVEYHCRIIQQQYVKRKAIEVGDAIAKKSYQDDTDIFDILDSSYKSLDQVSDWLFSKKPDDFKSNVAKLFQSVDSNDTGIPCSIGKLQKKLNGYQKSNLVVLAARPGMGKTAYVLNDAMKMAMQGIPVGIFSLEMSARELVARMFANFLSMNVEVMSLNKQNDFQLRLMQQKREEFEKLPIYIHDEPGISPLELKIQAKKWTREKGVQILFVDYLQLMRDKDTRGGNREQEVSNISRSMKALAKELDIPIMALSQLSRSVETRGGSKRPLLSDLRESGAIEQDADIVMFIYRPEYYKIDTWDDGSNTPTKDQAEIIIAKFRNGKTGSCVVGCKLEYMQFHDIDEHQYQEEEYIPSPATPSEAFGNENPFNNDNEDLPF